jgi:hypothetical protein
MFEVPGPHGYTREQCRKAVEWSSRWILGRPAQVDLEPSAPIPSQQLSAFGGRVPPDNINDRIQEILIPQARMETFRRLPDWENKRTEILSKLRTVVFRNMPGPHPGVKKMEWPGGAMALETEEGVFIGLFAVPDRPDRPPARQPAIVYVASPGETKDSIVWNFMRAGSFQEIPASRYVVFPRGIGTELWDDTFRKRVERSSMLLGRTLDEMRLYDVLCAVSYAASRPSFDGLNLTVAGKGVQGLLAAYAALLDSRVSRVILHSPPLTHMTGPVFLNVLRYTDVPQSLALLAPRELVFLGHEISAFDYTRGIYRLYRAEGSFSRAYTIGQVLNRGAGH